MKSSTIFSILKGIIKGLIRHQSEVSKSPGISFNDSGSGSYDKYHPSVINSIYDNVMDSIEETKKDKPEEINLEKPKITYGSDTQKY
tara:strand:+ start:509 stop:769 length:261 start_codon:yes stop_codon:yes gene_type:complete